MAGDWIKFEHSTLDKPEVLVLADFLETTPDDIVGKLLRIWVWFDKNSVNGDAGGVTGNALMRFIDGHVGRQGFAACMKKVGWLNENGVPNFDRHNGKSAKKRALTAARTREWRDAKGDDSVTRDASPEKRREEKNKQPSSQEVRGEAARKRARPLPEGFEPSSEIRAWADAEGFTPYLEAHLAYFVDFAKSKRKTYIDWDAAFRNCIRADWGDVRKGEQMRLRSNPVSKADARSAWAAELTGRGNGQRTIDGTSERLD